MPRYFFHVSGFKEFIDDAGVELADDDAAWSTAVISFGELLKDLDGRLKDRSELALAVRDETERRVVVLHLTAERFD